MKKEFEVGVKYDAIVNGQIWSFTYDGTDPEDEETLWITWMSGEEEAHWKGEILPLIEEYEVLKASGVIYPRGDTEEAQANALADLMAKPTYFFAGMEVPRALVLTDHFAPEGYRGDKEYMDFVFDPEKLILTITTPDSTAAVPHWVIGRFPVTATLKLDSAEGREKPTFLIEIKKEFV
ncbi:hypothetical protein EJP82_26770 [Paenibacillus anaericanus]|uniref:Uncharacterized protein n=1 Tax=Paenibacillus anaericanus TaxID=170367 RepID=A0A433XVJ6_9BACL|nr:hypothetical protein [Paenibacillus anaericanus]RUT38719.1 hypothetical protein EJP82_26770 [Paenibacillus anaericanus]